MQIEKFPCLRKSRQQPWPAVHHRYKTALSTLYVVVGSRRAVGGQDDAPRDREPTYPSRLPTVKL